MRDLMKKRIANATRSLFWASFLIVGGFAHTAHAIDPSDPLADAESYAGDVGVDLDEAASRLAIQGEVGELNAFLMLNAHDNFAGLHIQHQPVFRVKVLFKNLTGGRNQEFTGMLNRRIAKSQWRSIVKIRKVDLSLAELELAANEASSIAGTLGFPAETSVTVPTNRVQLDVLDAAAFSAALELAGLQLNPAVLLNEVAALSSEEVDIFGGLSLSTCTSGFSVRNTAGTRGVTTAAHCSNSQSFGGTSLTFQAEQNSGSVDLQWHRAPGFTVINSIQTCTGCRRTISGVTNRSAQAVGGYVCKFGRTTGYTCGFITTTSFRPVGTSTASPAATFVRVSNPGTDLSLGGDSGGPWFNSNNAYGSHKAGLGDDAIYMPADFFSALGLTILN